jgi:hypothetical protein
VLRPGVGRDSPTAISISKATALLEEIGQLKAIHFASPTARCVLDLCEDVALHLQDKARSLHRRSIGATGKAREGLYDAARNSTYFTYQLRGWLRFIVSADNAAPVADLVAPLESLVERYAPGVRVVVRPQWKYNFSYRHFAKLLFTLGRTTFDWTPKEFSAVAKKHGFATTRSGIPHIAVLSYAGLERRNALDLVMLAHEVGHLPDEHFDLSSGQDVRAALSRATDEQKHEVTSRHGSRKEKERRTAFVDELRKEARFWIRELVADVAALRLVGPAYIYALKASAYALATYEKLPQEHPPLRDRLHWVLSESQSSGLRYMDFLDRNADVSPIAAAIRDYLGSQAAEVSGAGAKAEVSPSAQEEMRRTERLRRLSRPATETALLRLRNEVLPGEKCFVLTDDVLRMADLLAREVPPCQSHVLGLDLEADKKRGPAKQHFSLAAILNAGWIFYLTHIRKDRENMRKDVDGRPVDPETIELQMVSDLVTLAVKQSSFLESYGVIRAEYDKS